jgi:hypothetical protein
LNPTDSVSCINVPSSSAPGKWWPPSQRVDSDENLDDYMFAVVDNIFGNAALNAALLGTGIEI